jgi:GNAT superfamily N-acetyltransferase
VKIKQDNAKVEGIRLSIQRDGDEIGRAFLYLMHNDLHKEPFGLLEDVFVEENARSSGIGTQLVKEVIRIAQEKGCYKLIATSRHTRPKVHELYKRLGFANHGLEFRMDFKENYT